MKVLVIQPKIGMGDMVIYLPYIHAISKKYQTPVSILVKENSKLASAAGALNAKKVGGRGNLCDENKIKDFLRTAEEISFKL